MELQAYQNTVGRTVNWFDYSGKQTRIRLREIKTSIPSESEIPLLNTLLSASLLPQTRDQRQKDPNVPKHS